jgi:hypothetical protein
VSATPKRASPCQWCGPTAAAARLVQPAGEATLTEDISRVLPMPSELAELFTAWPGGIRRGATVAGVGSTSLLLTLLAGAMAEGAWAAVVGMPAFGALAAHEAGIVLDRLALVPAPGPDWASAVGALIDGVDVVAAATPPGAPRGGHPGADEPGHAARLCAHPGDRAATARSALFGGMLVFARSRPEERDRWCGRGGDRSSYADLADERPPPRLSGTLPAV